MNCQVHLEGSGPAGICQQPVERAGDRCIDSSAGAEDQQIRQNAQDLCSAARPFAWTQAAATRPAQDRSVAEPHKDVSQCHCEGVMRAHQPGGCQASLRMCRSWHVQPGLTRQQGTHLFRRVDFDALAGCLFDILGCTLARHRKGGCSTQPCPAQYQRSPGMAARSCHTATPAAQQST